MCYQVTMARRRSSIWDPVVIAAAVAGFFGGIGAGASAFIDHRTTQFETQQEHQMARCQAAYTHSLDETPNPDISEELEEVYDRTALECQQENRDG